MDPAETQQAVQALEELVMKASLLVSRLEQVERGGMRDVQTFQEAAGSIKESTASLSAIATKMVEAAQENSAAATRNMEAARINSAAATQMLEASRANDVASQRMREAAQTMVSTASRLQSVMRQR